MPYAPTFPLAVEIAPDRPLADLSSMDGPDRDALAAMLVDVLGRLDAMYDQPLPYMLWLDQRPTTVGLADDAWFNIEIVSPWRAAGVQRFIAAAEIASDEYFNPVVPEAVADRLRALA